MKPFLCRPVTPFIINQKFGENKACTDIATETKYLTCVGTNPPEGYKSLYGSQGHLGLDLRATHGQPVYCAADGVVDSINTHVQSGLGVRVNTIVDGVKYQHMYWHLLGYQPQVGQQVKTGDLIGWADNTGYSSADHLHFQLGKEQNGLFIPIDPEPLMFDTYALNINTFNKIKEMVARLADAVADFLRR